MADQFMGITRLPLTTSPSCRSPVFDWWGQWGMEQNTRITGRVRCRGYRLVSQSGPWTCFVSLSPTWCKNKCCGTVRFHIKTRILASPLNIRRFSNTGPATQQAPTATPGWAVWKGMCFPTPMCRVQYWVRTMPTPAPCSCLCPASLLYVPESATPSLEPGGQ